MSKTKPRRDQNQTVTGIVTRVWVSGDGQNSAEVVVAIYVDGIDQAYAVYSPPTTEPSVFSSFVTILTAAFVTQTKIDLSWEPGPGPTPRIVELVCQMVTR